MCVTVWWQAEPWPEEVESLGEFRKAFPGVEIIGDPGPEGDACCLCPVDLSTTFARAGIRFECDPGYGYEVIRRAAGDLPRGGRG